jgi:hypothetical protein
MVINAFAMFKMGVLDFVEALDGWPSRTLNFIPNNTLVFLQHYYKMWVQFIGLCSRD